MRLITDSPNQKRKRNTQNRSRGEGGGGSPYLEGSTRLARRRIWILVVFSEQHEMRRDGERGGGGGCLYGRVRQGGAGILCRDGSARLVPATQFPPAQRTFQRGTAGPAAERQRGWRTVKASTSHPSPLRWWARSSLAGAR
jgi:hypothetical protein